MSRRTRIILIIRNLHESHWGKRIIEAEAAKTFSVRDRCAAGNWATCACGVQDPRLRCLDNEGVPWDSELLTLGQLFADWVVSNEFIRAACCLAEIELRAAEILSQPQFKGPPKNEA